jgi:hypothetical protein
MLTRAIERGEVAVFGGKRRALTETRRHRGKKGREREREREQS